jgi:hypothetical protein
MQILFLKLNHQSVNKLLAKNSNDKKYNFDKNPIYWTTTLYRNRGKCKEKCRPELMDSLSKLVCTFNQKISLLASKDWRNEKKETLVETFIWHPNVRVLQKT